MRALFLLALVACVALGLATEVPGPPPLPGFPGFSFGTNCNCPQPGAPCANPEFPNGLPGWCGLPLHFQHYYHPQVYIGGNANFLPQNPLWYMAPSPPLPYVHPLLGFSPHVWNPWYIQPYRPSLCALPPYNPAIDGLHPMLNGFSYVPSTGGGGPVVPSSGANGC